MKCSVHIYLLNEHFSQEYADIHHAGKDSELNRRYEWEDELEITTSVQEVVSHENTIYPLQGMNTDGSPFSYDVLRMRLFEIISEQGSTLIGCSESIFESSKVVQENGQFVVRIYLKDFEPMANPIPGIYIAAQEFPKELID